MLKGIIQYSHYLLETAITTGETVIDGTCGNGNDTLKLAKLVGEKGHVLGFDIQMQAIQNTKKRIESDGWNNVTYVLDSHANVATYLTKHEITSIGGAIFNLGYLPQGDKTVITKGASTIAAIEGILPFLKNNGIIVLVIYHGHEGGKQEKEAVLKYAIELDQKLYNVLQYRFINQKNDPPFIIAIQKK
ncbi:class I SAM-dependent methyltransferase [Virgibacillus sp. W0430]|uniref:tRNA (mnm(5)s(2)U34)-methyltransferase n=1 Tax=Virgibacillus sp. W0430 TaxID=3391580 RepID=UPI003F453671